MKMKERENKGNRKKKREEMKMKERENKVIRQKEKKEKG